MAGCFASIHADQVARALAAGEATRSALVASWQRQLDADSSFQLQTYYDEASRYTIGGSGGFTVNTYDVSAQHRLKLGDWNDVVWGLEERAIDSYREH